MNFIPRKSHRYAYSILHTRGVAGSLLWGSDQWDVLIFRLGAGFPYDFCGILQAKIQSFFISNIRGVDTPQSDYLDELLPEVADAFSQFWEWVDSYELHP